MGESSTTMVVARMGLGRISPKQNSVASTRDGMENSPFRDDSPSSSTLGDILPNHILATTIVVELSPIPAPTRGSPSPLQQHRAEMMNSRCRRTREEGIDGLKPGFSNSSGPLLIQWCRQPPLSYSLQLNRPLPTRWRGGGRAASLLWFS